MHHGTVKDKLVVDRTFKTNQQWVAQTPITNRDGPPKWSWFGVMFVLASFGMFSGKAEYPTVWVCACTKGCRKVYEKNASWSAIMDHLFLAHGIAKDAKHQTVLSRQAKDIRRLLPFSHVECPEFRATVHPAWKIIKTETQSNLVERLCLSVGTGSEFHLRLEEVWKQNR